MHFAVNRESVGSKFLGEHRFPGIELEDRVDAILVQIEEGTAAFVPTDIEHRDPLRGDAGLLRRVLEVGERQDIFWFLGSSKVNRLTEEGRDVLPFCDQPFVDGVELVSLRGRGEGQEVMARWE